MSWLFSRALVEEYSAGKRWGGLRSVPWNGSLTPQAYSSHDRTIDSFLNFPSGTTLGVLTEKGGEDLLMSFLAASLARTSASPERERELQEDGVAFGQKWQGSLAKYDQDLYSWKTAQCSLLGESERSSAIFPRWGTTVGGELYPLPMRGRSISVSASGSWPTPTVCGNYNRKGVSKTSGDGLATAVAKRPWPTPSAGNSKWNGTLQEWGVSWNWVRAEDPALARSPLNPTWVEWLMGWPLGWTDLDASATDKYRNVQPLPGESSPTEIKESA
jgi:hypothetical protein